MRPTFVSYTPADDDTDGFGNDLPGTSGVAFALTATTVGDSMAHLVIITPSGSVTGNYSLTGTDADGITQTETLATNTTNAVTSVKYYKTLTQVLAPTGIGAETVDIGWTDDVVSPTFPIDWASTAAANIFVDISGTINFTIQETFGDVLKPGAVPASYPWASISALASKTADTYGQTSVGATAFRVLLNSLTASATIGYYTDQPVRR